MTNRKCVTFTFCERQSHHIISYDQQLVSDIVHLVKVSLITSFPMTNSKWVTLHVLWNTVSSYIFLWPTVCEWHCTFCEGQSHHIFLYDQQEVSDIAQLVKGRQLSPHFLLWPQRVSSIAHFMKSSFITSSVPMTNSLWVTLHNLWKAVLSHLFYNQQQVSDIVKNSLITSVLMTNGREWVTLHICERPSHHIFSYDQQRVSDMKHFVEGTHMTNSEWATLHICEGQSHDIFCYHWQVVGDIKFCQKQSHHIILCISHTGSEWYYKSCERESHHIFCYQQFVSDITILWQEICLTTSFPITNRKWMTLPILWKAVYLINHFFSMTNSKWVTLLHIVWKAVSPHLLLWSTASVSHCSSCERHSHHIFSYDWQQVSTLHISRKAVPSHIFLWLTGSEWDCTSSKRQSCYIFPYDQQLVSIIPHFLKGNLITSLWPLQEVCDIAHFVKGSLLTSFPMTNSKWVTSLHLQFSHFFLACE